MGNYNFNEDLSVAKKTEQQITEILCDQLRLEFVGFNDNSAFDIELKALSGEMYTFEVKEDFMCKKTGNVSVEYECRGKRSGIANTKADMWVYKIHEPDGTIGVYVITTKKLIAMCKNNLWHRQVSGGDAGSGTMNFLFTLEVIKNNFIFLCEVSE